MVPGLNLRAPYPILSADPVRNIQGNVMANEQDIRFAAQKCKDALQRHDLSAAKAALGELRDLAQVFAGMQGQLKEPEQNERTRELKEQAEGETEGLKRKVSCPSCATPHPKRAKFCMECGKPMARRCGACGADLGKAKFCPECGAKAP